MPLTVGHRHKNNVTDCESVRTLAFYYTTPSFARRPSEIDRSLHSPREWRRIVPGKGEGREVRTSRSRYLSVPLAFRFNEIAFAGKWLRLVVILWISLLPE